MKIIEKIPGSDKATQLELSIADLDIIDAIIPPPFGELNRVPGLEWLNADKVEQEKDELIAHKNQKEYIVDFGFLSRLAFGFKASCEILDPCEMPTITAIDWKDAMELYGRLFHASHASAEEVNQENLLKE